MKSAITILMLVGLTWVGSGCGVAGYAAKVAGDPPTPAQYVPAQRPLVVIVKDQPDPTGLRVESEQISADIEQQISEYKIAPVIPSDRVREFHTRRPAEFSTMTPAAIGHAVGADQVLHIQIVSSTRESEAASDMLRGRIAAFVQVIDANAGDTLWPTDGSSGLLVEFKTPLKRLGDNTSPLTVDQSLHAGFADKVVKLFRPYRADE